MSHTTSISVKPLGVKRYAAIPALRHAYLVTTTKKWEPKSDLQRVFLRRVKAELEARGLSESALTKRVGGPKQKTLNEVMRGRDPRLKTVEQIAKALGVMPPWKLLKDDEPAVRDQQPPVGRQKYYGGSVTQSDIAPSKTGRKAKGRRARRE